MGLLPFALLAVVVAVLCHMIIRRYFLATAMAALLATTALQVIAYLDLGHLDKFFLIALATSGSLALLIASLVGVLVLWGRHRGDSRAAQQGAAAAEHN